jgi:hypothetical protein
MEREDENPAIERLAAFVGEWTMKAAFPDAPPNDLRRRTVFEWIPGKRFLVKRWEVAHPDAPAAFALD